MTDALYHRGPDSSGHHSRGELHLGARRLSIIDLDSGDQPIYNEAGDKAIVFNGEIYNYTELQAHLRERGHVLATRSDTEVVLHLYEEYGRDCVHHLRGMFAFAIDDGGSLFLARDRLGIKPLYYAHLADRGLFLFASEIKALLRCPEVGSELDEQAVVDSLMIAHLVGSGTLFRDVVCLDPGSTLEVRRAGDRIEVEKRSYYRPSIEPDESIGFEDAEQRLHEILLDTVAGHLQADVEVALLLSGGVDSSLLAALVDRTTGGRFRAFSTATEDEHPDLLTARQVAADLRVEHHVVVPTFEEYLAAVPYWIQCMEHMASLSGMTLLLMTREVGQRVKVCLCGEGSDEIFGGYPEFNGRFVNLDHYDVMLPRVQRAGRAPSPAVAEVVAELQARRLEGPDAYLHALFLYHQTSALVRHHLDCMDKVGMAASLEIRVPYMDHVLVEFVNRLPLALKVNRRLGILKFVLRRLAIDRYGPLLTNAAMRIKLGMPQSSARFQRRFGTLCEELLPTDYRRRHRLGRLFPNRTAMILFELFELIFVELRGEVPPDLDVVDFVRSRAAALPPARRSLALAGG